MVIVEIDGGVDESIPLLSSAKSVYIVEKGFFYMNESISQFKSRA